MAKSPNTNSYSFSWTQPYVAMNEFYIPKENKVDPRLELANELATLDLADKRVDEMLTFPDAERILNKLRNSRGQND